METLIHVSFNYGGWSISFKKNFNLPFAPFYGLRLLFNENEERVLVFDNNDYCTTLIDYNTISERFEVDVRNVWKQPVRDDVVDDILKEYAFWTRTDITNIDDLKELMNRNAMTKNN